jgi:acyl-CoA synthetase (AMP-forming)/AMP-acid ligase II
MDERDTLLAVTTLSFDISILELFLPITVGANIILATSEEVSNGEALLELLRSTQPTVMQATPSTWQILIAAGLRERLGIKILCGGEALTQNLASQLCTISDSVWNMYGPTETTIWSTCQQVVPEGAVSIGRPIANTQIYIVDEDMRLTLPGVPGELLIGGAGVSRGYLNRPDLNEKAFIPDVFSNGAGGRLYRTGDLARYRLDGSLEHLGRKDYQIKLRGFRIELGEIENVLSMHAAVRECAVVLHERSRGDQRLVAYVTLEDGESLDPSGIRDFLRSELPDYMLPAAFQEVEHMPLTDNGKIARDKLPAPALDGEKRKSQRDIPKRATEKKILEVWQTLLGTGEIGIHDNFFDVGGHSLLAIEATALLNEDLDAGLSVAQFFQFPSIAAMSAHLDGGGVTDETRSAADRMARRKEALARRKRGKRPAKKP